MVFEEEKVLHLEARNKTQKQSVLVSMKKKETGEVMFVCMEYGESRFPFLVLNYEMGGLFI